MAKPKPKARPVKVSSSRRFLYQQLMVLRVLALGLSVALIAYLIVSDFLGAIVLDGIGFAFVLWIVWFGAIAFVAHKRKWRSIAAGWNLWLGALCLTLALWGILGLIQPAGSQISGVALDEVSLGGNAGMYLVGNQGIGAPPAVRLALLIIGGLMLAAPATSIHFLMAASRVAQTSGVVVIRAAGRLAIASGRRLGHAYRELSPHKRLAGAIATLVSRPNRRRHAEPEAPAVEVVAPQAPIHPIQAQLSPIEAQPAQVESPRPHIPEAEYFVAKPSAIDPAAPKLDTAGSGQLPPLSLLDEIVPAPIADADNIRRARLIEDALSSYGVEAKVTQINPGPTVTQFGVEPGWDRRLRRIIERDEQGKPKLDKSGHPIERVEEVSKTRVKVERITALSQNLALALAATTIRIEAPVPGQPLVGIEVPNTDSVAVSLKSVIESTAFQKARARSKLALALGIGTAGEPVATDLAKMPHLLIAGTTGSGKSVCLNAIVTCLLMHNHPREVRLMIIDPKQVEFVHFAGMPHLIAPLVTKLDKAVDALRRVIREMDSRFEKFAAVGVKNLEKYNQSPLTAEPLPYLVVLIDELNQLMLFSGEVVEASICRLAQLGRATGIHLILATQRPSTDVITGVIKANFPSRIAFKLPAYVDSRTILDTGGAEKLLGGGDMLYLPTDTAKARRLRGCFVADHEIDKVARFWLQYREESPETATVQPDDSVASAFASLSIEENADDDAMLPSARTLARETSHISTSLIQRRLRVGYPRAARIMDALEKEGVVVRNDPGGPAEVIDVFEEEE